MADTFTIYPRQTIDRAKHPDLGEGTAVYDNGPARFIADSGAVVAYARIGGGGCSAVGPMRSWLNAVTPDGQVVRLDTSGRTYGESHHRVVTFEGVHGWMVDMVSKSGDVFRFEPDDGEVECRECDYVAPTPKPAPVVQGDLFGGKDG